MINFQNYRFEAGKLNISGVPPGSESLLVAKLLKELPEQDILFIARDEIRMVEMEVALSIIIPEERLLLFPAWDCLPYDKVSPKREVSARRMNTLTELSSKTESSRVILLTTCNASLQRISTKMASSKKPFQIMIMCSIRQEHDKILYVKSVFNIATVPKVHFCIIFQYNLFSSILKIR